MSNTVTYEAINNEVADDISDVTLENTRDTVEAPSSTNKPTNNNTIVPPKGNDGPNVGLILGVVVAVVVVAGVVAFIFIKKKKAE